MLVQNNNRVNLSREHSASLTGGKARETSQHALKPAQGNSLHQPLRSKQPNNSRTAKERVFSTNLPGSAANHKKTRKVIAASQTASKENNVATDG